MDEIINQEGSIQEKSIVKRVRELNDGYFVIETNKTIILTNGKNIYDIKEYPKVKKVMVINNELYIFQCMDFVGTLVRLKDMKVIFSEFDVFDVLPNYRSDKILWLCSNGPSALLYNIEENRYVNRDVPYHLYFVVSDNLFVYEDLKYDADYKKKTHLYNDKGELVLECGFTIPYYKNGNIILRDDDDIRIYHDFLGENKKVTILSKQGNVLAKPQIYKDNFVIVVDGFIKIINSDLEEVKSIPYDTSREISDTIIEKDYFMMKVKIEDEVYKTVAVSLVHGFVVEHDFMHVLPYWEDNKRRTIVAYDRVINPEPDNTYYGRPNEYTYTLYAEDGKVLFKSDEKFLDVEIISKEKDNLYLFISNEQTYIFNIDTLEFKPMPWIDEIIFNDDGHAFCLNGETNLYDVIDEDLNVLFKNVDAKKLGVTPHERPFVFLLNNLICFIENLPFNEYYLMVVDEEGNKYFGGKDATVNKVGNYIEVVHRGKIIYINSITKTVSDNSIPALPNNLSSDLTIEGDQIKLNRKNNNEQK